ncbi:hypothetical protein [Plasmodium yoelii yoelii]|uniref:Uncharacterized protein n=1 Tax=Plasmodium yoelii yoelii TaxID=73239 RepID=Q7RBB2_PLAYO|nr:hypothetical protein [Plasmodium yoelii yoelii]
MLFLKSFPKSK